MAILHKRILEINKTYLQNLVLSLDWKDTLYHDMHAKNVFDGGKIIIDNPKDHLLGSFYKDVRSYLTGMMPTGNYKIIPRDRNDYDPMYLILGGQIAGNQKNGYYFSPKN